MFEINLNREILMNKQSGFVDHIDVKHGNSEVAFSCIRGWQEAIQEVGLCAFAEPGIAYINITDQTNSYLPEIKSASVCHH